MLGTGLADLQQRYIDERPKYEKLANLVRETIEKSALERNLLCSVSPRAKDVNSFLAKALAKRYADPYNEITDKAGVRVVAHFPWALDGLEALVKSSFCILECDDKRLITPPDRFVYRATHFQVTHPTAPNPLRRLECEVQVLTRAESLWADTTHDLFYKPPVALPDQTKRTFHRLMSLMELFDSEVLRAKEEMSTIGGFPGAQLLRILEPHHRRLTGRDYDEELSGLVLDFFAERILSESMNDIESSVGRFVLENSQKLEALFRRYRDDDHANPLIWQPEIFIILLHLETSPFILQELWSDILPVELLVSLADDWGVAISR